MTSPAPVVSLGHGLCEPSDTGLTVTGREGDLAVLNRGVLFLLAVALALLASPGLGTVAAYGDDLLISNNQISGPAAGPLIDVTGNRIGVTDNELSGTTGYGIQAETLAGFISTDVTIARNTFNRGQAHPPSGLGPR